MNSWRNRLFVPSSGSDSLPYQIDALFEQQRTTWKLFRHGEESLKSITTRTLTIDNSPVIVQANPGRSISTNAHVDPASISKRPCFLCPDALPGAERGIAYGSFIFLPNPYPIVPKHMTIAFHRHDRQEISGHLNDFITLTTAAGPEMFLLYNGPRCGASAPDHMHFQTAESSSIPLFNELKRRSLPERMAPFTIGGRNLFAGRFSDSASAVQSLDTLIGTYARLRGDTREPMLNIVARYENGSITAALFPREKHRSACYFAPEDERLSISPAAIEMAGIIVVADVNHFSRVDETVASAIYQEVTINASLFHQLTEEIR
jgi:hypothetical protein